MNINSTSKVLIIVAHPDDETIGLGGTIAKHSYEGDEVYALAMTDGVGSRESTKETDVNNRAKAASASSTELGFKWLDILNYPDNKLDSVPLLDIVKSLEKFKRKINPQIIYTHSSSDLNIDHRIINQAVLTAFRPQPNEIWSEIRNFEIPSSTDYGHKSVTNSFYPNLYIDITAYWEMKLKALKHYSEEIREFPHSRSYEGIKNLAKYRGIQVGLKYAESFEVIRKIIR